MQFENQLESNMHKLGRGCFHGILGKELRSASSSACCADWHADLTPQHTNACGTAQPATDPPALPPQRNQIMSNQQHLHEPSNCALVHGPQLLLHYSYYEEYLLLNQQYEPGDPSSPSTYPPFFGNSQNELQWYTQPYMNACAHQKGFGK